MKCVMMRKRKREKESGNAKEEMVAFLLGSVPSSRHGTHVFGKHYGAVQQAGTGR